MTVQESFAQQFIKQGMAYGLTQVQASTFFKSAAEKHANEWGAQLQSLLGGAKDFAQQNPTGAGAIVGGLGGAAAGAMAGGQGNRMMGALGGGALGAGLGGAAGLSIDPNMQKQIMQLLGQGQGRQGISAGAEATMPQGR